MRRAVVAMALAVGVAIASPAFASFLEGFHAFQEGKYCKALEEWRDDARNGNGSAAFGMAELYSRGLCVKADQRRASEWYLKSALGGFARARSELGVRYAYGKGVKADVFRSYLWLSAARLTTANWDVVSRQAIDANLSIITPLVPAEEKMRADSILAAFSKEYKMPREFEKLD